MAFTTVGTVKKISETRSKNADVAKLVKRFKACPSEFKAIHECFSFSERNAIKDEAEKFESEGKFCLAGIEYAKLAKFSEARVMATMCAKKGDKKGQKKIMDEIEVRKRAIAQAERSM